MRQRGAVIAIVAAIATALSVAAAPRAPRAEATLRFSSPMVEVEADGERLVIELKL